MVSVVVAGDGPLATALAGWYRETGAKVAELSFDRELEAQLRPLTGQVDLLVIADGFEPEPGSVEAIDRQQLGAAMHRLTFLPFRLAALLQPQLSAARGRVVLLSRTDARMEVPDSTGRYLERPFRAAAHTLWRCLSVEWRNAGISAGLVAIDPDAVPPVAELARVIAGGEDEPFPVELADIGSHALGW